MPIHKERVAMQAWSSDERRSLLAIFLGYQCLRPRIHHHWQLGLSAEVEREEASGREVLQDLQSAKACALKTLPTLQTVRSCLCSPDHLQMPYNLNPEALNFGHRLGLIDLLWQLACLSITSISLTTTRLTSVWRIIAWWCKTLCSGLQEQAIQRSSCKRTSNHQGPATWKALHQKLCTIKAHQNQIGLTYAMQPEFCLQPPLAHLTHTMCSQMYCPLRSSLCLGESTTHISMIQYSWTLLTQQA